MGMSLFMTVPPLKYLDITMTNTYRNSVDARGKKIGAPLSGFQSANLIS